MSPRVTVGLVEAAVGRVLPLRGELIALCGERAAPVLDRLPMYARATTQAQVEEKALALSNNLSDLHDALRADYGLVITELDSLVLRKVLESSVIAPARGIHPTGVLASGVPQGSGRSPWTAGTTGASR